MSKQVQEAYIVAATRTPVGKAPRGMFRNMRPDDLLVRAIRSAMRQVPGLDPKLFEDAIVGCSFPEGESGLNMARNAVVELLRAPQPITQLELVRQVLAATGAPPPPGAYDPGELGAPVDGELMAGDVLVFEVDMAGRTSRHVGVYAGSDRFAYGSSEGARERDLDRTWRSRLVTVRRVR